MQDKKTLDFIEKARKIHGDKYDYSLVDYKNARTKVKLICPIHGEFNTHPDSHINRSHGCHSCGKLSSEEKRKDNFIGWGLTNWEKIGIKSKYFTGFKLYIIECYNNEESFIKIGRTFTDVKYRFEDRNKMPYKWRVIKLINENAKQIFNLEKELHKQFKKFKYKPSLKFAGINECFDISIKALI